MPNYTEVHVVPDAHKNAYNTLLAMTVFEGDDPATSENASQPLNATGNPNDPITHWFGSAASLPYAKVELLQTLSDHVPAEGQWPIEHTDGYTTLTAPVDHAAAAAAAAAQVVTVTTRDSYTPQQSAETLAAALDALGLQRLVYPEW